MPTTARRDEVNATTAVVHLAFELGATEWKLGFTTGLGLHLTPRFARRR